MKRFKLILIFSLIIQACSSSRVSKEEKEWVIAFKNVACIACFNAGSATNLDDISNTINFDLLSNTIYYRKADALGKSYNNNIAPSVNLDHHDKRVIANSCLEFYISPKLNSIAFSEYQKFKEHNKQKYE